MTFPDLLFVLLKPVFGAIRVVGVLIRPLTEPLDRRAARRLDKRFEAHVRREVAFLFERRGGRIVETDDLPSRRSFDHAFATVKVDHLLIKFVRGRGEIAAYVAPEEA